MNNKIYAFIVLLSIFAMTFIVGCSTPGDGGDDTPPDTLAVPDTTQPDSTGVGTITSVNSISIGYSPLYVQKYDDLLIVATFMGGYYLKIFSLTDPENPEQIGSLNINNIANAMDVCGDIVFISVGNKIMTIDISDPYSPSVAGEFTLLEQGIGLAAGDDNLFIGYMASGGTVFDISDPANIQIVGSITTSFKSGDYFYGKLLCSPANSEYVYYYDVSTPSSPQYIATGNTGGQNNDIALTPWGFLYVAAGTRTGTNDAVFAALDVHAISEAFQDISTNQDSRRVAYQDNFAYVVFHDDASNTDIMRAYFTYHIDTAYSFYEHSYSNIQDLDAGGGYIYIASMDDGGTIYILKHEY